TVWLLLGLLAVVAAAAVYWWPAGPPATEPAEGRLDNDIEEPVAHNPGYLGAQACAPCHAERVEQFQATNHFRACRIPRAGDMPDTFTPEKGTLISHVPGLRFEMSQRGDDFMQTAIRSEEHTSELQSPDHLVCRLLLEKKKTASPSTSRDAR